MLDAESRIASRGLPLQALKNGQHPIDCEIAVGMNADLPTSQVGFASSVIQLLRRCRLQTAKFRHILVRL